MCDPFLIVLAIFILVFVFVGEVGMLIQSSTAERLSNVWKRGEHYRTAQLLLLLVKTKFNALLARRPNIRCDTIG